VATSSMVSFLGFLSQPRDFPGAS